MKNENKFLHYNGDYFSLHLINVLCAEFKHRMTDLLRTVLRTRDDVCYKLSCIHSFNFVYSNIIYNESVAFHRRNCLQILTRSRAMTLHKIESS